MEDRQGNDERGDPFLAKRRGKVEGMRYARVFLH